MSLNAAPQPILIRRAGQLGLAGLALGACFSAWAMQKEAPPAQPAPAAPVAVPAPVAAPVAKVPLAKAAAPAAAPKPAPEAGKDVPAAQTFDVSATYGLASGAEKTVTMKGVGANGATIQSAADVNGGCDDEWTVRQNSTDTVMFSGAIYCDGKLVSKPRMEILIGQTGTLELTGDEGKPRFRLKVKVSRT